MEYRKFKADHLFDGYRLYDSEMVLITDEAGVVQNIVPGSKAGDDVQQFSGILSPGFINCHCHLELSHLKNVIPPHTGLIEFLCTVVTKRDFDPAIIQQEIINAEEEMYRNGIVAVADISNTADTAFTKSISKIRWQNFVEVLSFTDEKAEKNVEYYKKIAEEFKAVIQNPNQTNRTSLVPHAPYTISPKTFRLINEETKGKIISIHNQENPAENELYKTGTGDFLKFLHFFGINSTPFPITGKSSIQSYLPYFQNGQTIFLIHNTFISEEDIIWAADYAAMNNLNLIYCLCINANLYIENKTAPIDQLVKHNCKIVLGTDSYSSNWQLSIAKEMEALLNHSSISKEKALQMATMNGAKALQWDDVLGSFEKGKQPGVVLLSNDLSESERLL